MVFSQEVPAVTDAIDAALPPWAQGLSLLTLLLIIVIAFLRGWVVTARQNERDIAAERRVSDIHEANAERAMALNDKIASEVVQPLLDGNAAILRAVSEVQEEQRRMRDRRPR